MADTPNDNTSPKDTPREAQDAMHKEITSLKRDTNKINRALAERAEQVADEAGGLFGSATGGASRAARQLGTQAHTVSETVQANPGTVSSAFVLGGIFGLLIGIALGKSDMLDRRWL